MLIWSRDRATDRKRSYWVSSVEQAAEIVSTLQPGDTDIYFGCGLAGMAHGPHQRCTSGDERPVVAIPGLWADIDVAGPGHGDSAYPQYIDDAIAPADSTEALGFKPSVIVHTVGRFYAATPPEFPEVWS